MANKVNEPESPSEFLEEATNLDPEEAEFRRIERQLNHKLDNEILAAPEKMPKAVYYIIPNEFAERFLLFSNCSNFFNRFCFYGINPLLNPLFKIFLKMGPEAAFVKKTYRMHSGIIFSKRFISIYSSR